MMQPSLVPRMTMSQEKNRKKPTQMLNVRMYLSWFSVVHEGVLFGVSGMDQEETCRRFGRTNAYIRACVYVCPCVRVFVMPMRASV